ncbi:sensor histidine kinase [Roseateles oligotrophus]|uniref:histidine kinase n=1 Tax=Roseateles oligotrophus TaxID=1769250 RepID=A0ABT2YM29_9BURK|nr:PAS domain-containing sensor histidine kinase [Roseateles oligotrophus]MCV2371106.1 PAS domain-containing sensor histidine kinase [Roseateles oligotrophus]
MSSAGFSKLAGQLWPQRFKHQLALMMSFLLVLALTLLGGFTAQQQESRARAAVEAQAALLARSLAEASTNLILVGSLDGIEALALSYAAMADVRRLSIFSPQGKPLTQVVHEAGQSAQASYADPQRQRQLPAVQQPQMSLTTEGSLLTVWQPVQTDEQLLAWIQLDYDLSELHRQSHVVWRNTALMALLAVLLCYPLLMAFLRRPMESIDSARRFAVELADDVGTAPLVLEGPLEIQQLQRALNDASMLLQQHLILLTDGIQTHQAQSKQLAAQNDQLGAIFTNSPDGLLTFNRKGKVEFTNQAFLRMTGLREDEVLGQDDLGLDAKLMERAVEGCEFAGLAASFGPNRQTLTLRGEPPKVLAISGRQTTAASVSLALYVRDETQQHELDRMKSEFLTLAAHELRTPMASIFGFVELLINREFSDAKRADLLGRIHRQSKLMINILNELLDLARIEARGASEFKFEMLDLAELVTHVLSDYLPPQGRERPLFEPVMQAMPVHVDRQKMQQALLNTLSNAYKYSPGGEPVSIRLLVDEPEEGRVHYGVEIRDRGIGLSPAHLARMGERFFRADASGHIPGTGLGVSIVRELLELMGGRLQIESELGQGTCVSLWL